MKKRFIFSIIGVISLILITIGMSYAFFNYVKIGTTENTVTSGILEFLYTEVEQIGAGIRISDAYPIGDELGKVQTGAGKEFNFKITSKLSGNYDIPYTITARKKNDSTLDGKAVRIYLTEVTGAVEEERLLDNYNNLSDYEKAPSGITEKVIYTGLVPTGSTNYEKEFKLRMWIDETLDFSPTTNESGSDIYPYNEKIFTITVNVYANAKVVTDAEIDMANTTSIKSITVNDLTARSIENDQYDYELNVKPDVTEVNINIETTNPEATVEITNLDSLVVQKSSIQKLSNTKVITLQLKEGDTLFKIKVTSANKQMEKEYILKIGKRQYGLENTSYKAGSKIEWAGLNWYVMEDTGTTVKLILSNNYKTGVYGESTDYINSTAYTELNTNFTGENSIISEAIQEGSIEKDSNSSAYIRLPYYEELNINIPNDSNTVFWTMSNNDNKIYLGNNTGINIKNYEAQTTANYYVGYSTTLAGIEKTGITSVEEKPLSQNPNESTVTYNENANIVSKSTAYGSQYNVTAATASGYSCDNSSCPNSYCSAKTQPYYGNNCQIDSTFTYYVLGNWWNPNYNVWVNGSTCGANTIYYANGNCSNFYEVTEATSDIGYRPVIEIFKK